MNYFTSKTSSFQEGNYESTHDIDTFSITGVYAFFLLEKFMHFFNPYGDVSIVKYQKELSITNSN